MTSDDHDLKRRRATDDLGALRDCLRKAKEQQPRTTLVDIVVPLRTTTGQNVREHWAVRSKRVAFERDRTGLALRYSGPPPTRAGLPMLCTLTRIGPRLCDSDNLQGGLKAVRDEVGAWLGTGDAHDGPVTWDYKQERGAWGVRVTIQEIP